MMITIDQINTLLSEDIRKVVAQNIGNDPVKIALNKKLDNAQLIATQVKYLQRAKHKLPSYYNAQCIIPSLAFEQSSNEECAAHKTAKGDLCIDLTCGLGVDSLHLARNFNRVISIEQNPTLAYLAKENFKRLNANNIDIVCSSAEEFISSNTDIRADMIYVDPDRRGTQGEKLFKLEDCSPNILAMMPELLKISSRIVVKCSPLMDVDEAFRLFGKGSCVEVVSLCGECKEVVVSTGNTSQQITATAIGIGSATMAIARGVYALPEIVPMESYRYMIIPDVALQKARMAKELFSMLGVCITSDNSYGFCTNIPEKTIGKVFEIERIEQYTPKHLKKLLKELSIKKITILKRGFPYPSSQILKELSVAEGGNIKIAFTTLNNELLAIFLR